MPKAGRRRCAVPVLAGKTAGNSRETECTRTNLSSGTPRPIVWLEGRCGRSPGSRVSVLHPPSRTHPVARGGEALADDSCGGSSGVQTIGLAPDSLLIPDRGTINGVYSTGWRQPSSSIGQLQHDLADVLAGLQFAVGSYDLVQRKPAMDDRANPSGADGGPDLGFDFLRQRNLEGDVP